MELNFMFYKRTLEKYTNEELRRILKNEYDKSIPNSQLVEATKSVLADRGIGIFSKILR